MASRRERFMVLETVNPIVPANTLVVESDTGRTKMGDGTTRYNALPYSTEGAGAPVTEVDPVAGAALSAHAADQLLHSSGKELACSENVSGVLQSVNSTVLADITGCVITVPAQARPYYVEGEAMLDVSTAPAAAATGQMQLVLVDDAGTGLAAWEGCIEGGAGTAGQFTGRVKGRIPAGASAKTYRLQVSRGSTAFTFDVKNGSGSPVFKSWIAAYSV